MSTPQSKKLISILLKVSESEMDVDTAEKKIIKLFANNNKIGSGLNLRELELRLDKAIKKETRKSFSDWLKKYRENERKAHSKSQ